MKLPRYQQQGKGIGRASRSLTAGVQTSSLGGQIAKGLSNIGTKFLDYQMKMQVADRDARVKLKAAEVNSEISNVLLEFKDPANQDYLTPRTYTKKFEDYIKNKEEQLKTELGEDYKYLAPTFIEQTTKGKIGTQEIVFDQILKNQKTAAETTTNTYLYF